jgi:hypothetical protein
MKAKLTCPHCGHEWTLGYWEWIFTTLFHFFDIFSWRDYRYTKCPICEQKSWLRRR